MVHEIQKLEGLTSDRIEEVLGGVVNDGMKRGLSWGYGELRWRQ